MQKNQVKINKRVFELNVLSDGAIEFFDIEDPVKEGIVFNNKKEVYKTINFLTDVMEGEEWKQ